MEETYLAQEFQRSYEIGSLRKAKFYEALLKSCVLFYYCEEENWHIYIFDDSSALKIIHLEGENKMQTITGGGIPAQVHFRLFETFNLFNDYFFRAN